MRLQFIRTMELLLASRQSFEGAFVLLYGIVDQFMSLQLIFPIEGCWTDVTLKRVVPGVNQDMGTEVILRLETLLANFASELADRCMRDQVAPQVTFAGEDFLAFRTGIVVGGGL